MTRVLLTGISGVGKSSVTLALAARGHRSVDLDTDAYSEWADVGGEDGAAGTPVEPGRDWVWREDRVHELLSAAGAEDLFVSGCAANMGRFLQQFDHVILLSAAPDLIAERLATRTNNPYGKRPDEVARVLDQITSVEPLLRRAAGHEIDTAAPLDDVVAAVLQIVTTNSP